MADQTKKAPPPIGSKFDFHQLMDSMATTKRTFWKIDRSKERFQAALRKSQYKAQEDIKRAKNHAKARKMEATS